MTETDRVQETGAPGDADRDDPAGPGAAGAVPGPSRVGPDRLSMLVVVAVVVLELVTLWHHEWVSDSWLHLATVAEVARHPLHPLEPLTGQDVSFPYYSPYVMALGWAARVAHVSASTALTISAPVALALLLVSLHRLARVVMSGRWGPLWVLVLTLTLWGTHQWFWSGFPSLDTLSVGAAWPSVLAMACWFQLWRQAWVLRSAPGRSWAAAVLTLPGLTLLLHPFTFACAMISCAVTVICRRPPQRRMLGALALAASSVALAALWPWIDLRDLVRDTSAFDAIHRFFYDDTWTSFGLLVVAGPLLVVRMRRSREDPLVWSAVLGLAIVGLGGAAGLYSLGRLLPLVAVCAHLAIADEITRVGAARGSVSRNARRLYRIVVAAAVAVGLMAQLPGLARAVVGDRAREQAELRFHLISPYPRIDFIRAYIHYGDVAVSNDGRVERELPALGVRPLTLPWPSPAVTGATARAAAERTILSSRTTPSVRHQVTTRQAVSWILWVPNARTHGWPHPDARLVACGPGGMQLLTPDVSAGVVPPRCAGWQRQG